MLATVAAIISLAVLVLVLFIVGEGPLLTEMHASMQFDSLTNVMHIARCGHWSCASEVPAQAALLLDAPQL